MNIDYVAEIYQKPTKKEIYIFSDRLCCIFVKTQSSERIIPPTTRRPERHGLFLEIDGHSQAATGGARQCVVASIDCEDSR